MTRKRRVRLILCGLQSVIGLWPEEQENVAWPDVHHASFLDFLRDPKRSGRIHSGNPKRRTWLAHHILNTFSAGGDDPARLHLPSGKFSLIHRGGI
jgi:hypothetical protein